MELTTNQQKVMDLVSEMSVLELSQLVKAMEEKFGVSAAAPAAVAVAAPTAAAPTEEQTSFDVVLESGGDKKIEVIKLVKTYANLGLAEAKALVDGAPKTVKEQVAKEEAQKMKSEIEAVGGTVTLK
ncbi:50S ribosomal protein L7/L12 [bacterium]|nr:MAG: 50S ribosomal protein L7/L12 [bacterium]